MPDVTLPADSASRTSSSGGGRGAPDPTRVDGSGNGAGVVADGAQAAALEGAIVALRTAQRELDAAVETLADVRAYCDTLLASKGTRQAVGMELAAVIVGEP